MKLTRRDFLKSGAITALALAVGLKPAHGGYITKMPPVHSPGCILPEELAISVRRSSAMVRDNLGLSILIDGDFLDGVRHTEPVTLADLVAAKAKLEQNQRTAWTLPADVVYMLYGLPVAAHFDEYGPSILLTTAHIAPGATVDIDTLKTEA